MKAEPNQWKREPFGEMASLPYEANFSASQHEKLSEGLIPRAMEDKWFIYMDGSELCFHRSWTGQAIYRLTMRPSGDAYAVADAQCAKEMLDKSDPAYQGELLDFLIHNLLLGEARPFPRPAGMKEPLPGVYQHAISGTGYAEKVIPRRPWWKLWG